MASTGFRDHALTNQIAEFRSTALYNELVNLLPIRARAIAFVEEAIESLRSQHRKANIAKVKPTQCHIHKHVYTCTCACVHTKHFHVRVYIYMQCTNTYIHVHVSPVQVTGNSVSLVGGGLLVGGFIAAPFTLGASLILSGVGTGVCAVGGTMYDICRCRAC